MLINNITICVFVVQVLFCEMSTRFVLHSVWAHATCFSRTLFSTYTAFFMVYSAGFESQEMCYTLNTCLYVHFCLSLGGSLSQLVLIFAVCAIILTLPKCVDLNHKQSLFIVWSWCSQLINLHIYWNQNTQNNCKNIYNAMPCLYE